MHIWLFGIFLLASAVPTNSQVLGGIRGIFKSMVRNAVAHQEMKQPIEMFSNKSGYSYEEVYKFIPKYEINSHLTPYLKIVQNFYAYRFSNYTFSKELNAFITTLEKHESKVPNKIAAIKIIFSIEKLTFEIKLKIAIKILDLVDNNKDLPKVIDEDNLNIKWDDSNSYSQNIENLFNFLKDIGIKNHLKLFEGFSIVIPPFDINGNLMNYLKVISDTIQNYNIQELYVDQLSQLNSNLREIKTRIPNKVKVIKLIFAKANSFPLSLKLKIVEKILLLISYDTDLPNIDVSKLISNWNENGSITKNFGTLINFLKKIGGSQLKSSSIKELISAIPYFDTKEKLVEYLKNIHDMIPENELQQPFVADLSYLISNLRGEKSSIPIKVDIIKWIFMRRDLPLPIKVKVSKRILNTGSSTKDIKDKDAFSIIKFNWPDTESLTRKIGMLIDFFRNNLDSPTRNRPKSHVSKSDTSTSETSIDYALRGNENLSFFEDLINSIPCYENEGNLLQHLIEVRDLIIEKHLDLPYAKYLSQLILDLKDGEGTIPKKINTMKWIFSKQYSFPLSLKLKITKRLLNADIDLSSSDSFSDLTSNLDEDASITKKLANLNHFLNRIGESKFDTQFVSEMTDLIPNLDSNVDLLNYLQDVLESINETDINLSFVKDLSYLVLNLQDKENKIPNKIAFIKWIFRETSIPLRIKIKICKNMLNIRGPEKDLSSSQALSNLKTDWSNTESLTKKIGSLIGYLKKIEAKDSSINDTETVELWNYFEEEDASASDSSTSNSPTSITLKDISRRSETDPILFEELINYLLYHEKAESIVQRLIDVYDMITEKNIELPYKRALKKLISKLKRKEDTFPKKMFIVKWIFTKAHIFSVEIKIKLAMKVLTLRGHNTDISSINNLSNLISSWDEDISDTNQIGAIIRSLKEIDRSQFEAPFTEEFTKLIPNINENENLLKYLSDVYDTITENDIKLPFITDLEESITKLQRKNNRIPNKVAVIKWIFMRRSLPLCGKIKICIKILTLRSYEKDSTKTGTFTTLKNNWSDNDSWTTKIGKLIRFFKKIGITDTQTPQKTSAKLKDNIQRKDSYSQTQTQTFFEELTNAISYNENHLDFTQYLNEIHDMITDIKLDLPYASSLQKIISNIREKETKIPNKIKVLKWIFSSSHSFSLNFKLNIAKRVLAIIGHNSDIPSIDDFTNLISNFDDDGSNTKKIGKLLGFLKKIGGSQIDIPFITELIKLIPVYDGKRNLVPYLKDLHNTFIENNINIPFVRYLSDLITHLQGKENLIPNKVDVLKWIFSRKSLPLRMKINISLEILKIDNTEKDLINSDDFLNFKDKLSENLSSTKKLGALMAFLKKIGIRGTSSSSEQIINNSRNEPTDIASSSDTYTSIFDELASIVPYYENDTDFLLHLTDLRDVIIENHLNLTCLQALSKLISNLTEQESRIPNKFKTFKWIFNRSVLPLQIKMKLSEIIFNFFGHDVDLPSVESFSDLISRWDDSESLPVNLAHLIGFLVDMSKNQKIDWSIVEDLTNIIPYFDGSSNLESYLAYISGLITDKTISLSFVKDLFELRLKLQKNEDKMPNKVAIIKELFNKATLSLRKKITFAIKILSQINNGDDLPNKMDFLDFILHWPDSKSLFIDTPLTTEPLKIGQFQTKNSSGIISVETKALIFQLPDTDVRSCENKAKGRELTSAFTMPGNECKILCVFGTEVKRITRTENSYCIINSQEGVCIKGTCTVMEDEKAAEKMIDY